MRNLVELNKYLRTDVQQVVVMGNKILCCQTTVNAMRVKPHITRGCWAKPEGKRKGRVKNASGVGFSPSGLSAYSIAIATIWLAVPDICLRPRWGWKMPH